MSELPIFMIILVFNYLVILMNRICIRQSGPDWVRHAVNFKIDDLVNNILTKVWTFGNYHYLLINWQFPFSKSNGKSLSISKRPSAWVQSALNSCKELMLSDKGIRTVFKQYLNELNSLIKFTQNCSQTWTWLYCDKIKNWIRKFSFEKWTNAMGK